MKKLIGWCKDNFFSLSALFLLAFIPLYPKLPLFDVVKTWVYVRLEDILIAGILFVFAIYHIRKKTIPGTFLTWPIGIYWVVGLMSAVISILFIGPHLTTYTPFLTILHFLRRIEYMMLFFLAYHMIAKHKGFLRAVIWTLGVTVLLIALYGAGQKFLGFPAFLTMNEEFAKGVPLRLPPTARIPSTFGGHYDLGAYMVMVIPLLASLVFGVKKWWEKLVFFGLSVLGLVTLLFTASRVSFGVYLVAITTMLVWQKKKILIVPVIILSMFLLNSVSSASERFYKTFRYSDVIVDLSSGKPIGTLDRLEGTNAVLEVQERPDEESLPTGSEFIGIATGGTGQAKTIEVISNKPLATGSGEIATVSGSFLIQKALVYDISITTRFQGQWPKAVEAFRRNILLGSGFSTLSVASDGDYLRMLGETGILGSVAFLGILGVAFGLFFRKKNTLGGLEQAFVVGVFSGIVGLLLNAVLIDVFEASKVAYSLWLLLGVAIAILSRDQLTAGSYVRSLWQFFTHRSMFVVYICLFAIFYHLSVTGWYFLGDDFTWLRWAAESKFSDIGTVFTDAAGFFYRPVPKIWYFLLYSVFWLKPGVYHFASLILLATSASFVYLIAVSTRVSPVFSLLGSVLFMVLAVHHENVFWISGQSSLLAAALLFASVWVFGRAWSVSGRASVLRTMLAILLLFLSMCSYDGMIVAPLIVFLLGITQYKQGPRKLIFILVVIPFYWFVRQFSGAVMPSGDYGYKLSTFFVNSAANGIGYTGAAFLGPRVIEHLDVIRVMLRESREYLLIVITVLASVVIPLLFRIVRTPRWSRAALWFFAGFISLIAYAPLGGMAERYVFIASGFWIIALVNVFWELWRLHASRVIVKGVLILLYVALLGFNMNQTDRLRGDWQKASEIAQKSILTIKRQYFPLDNAKAFVIVNMPTRIGRAWVFPVGFEDALWHMFRMNSYPYAVYKANSVEEALALPVGKASHEVLSFEGEQFELRRITKEIYLEEQLEKEKR